MVTEFQIIDNLRIRTNDRIAIFGRTGAGKTHLAKNWLLPQYDKFIFWDIKHENNDIKHDIILRNPKELKRNITKYNNILYQPDDLTDKDFNSVCEIVFESRNNSLYVDEAALISTPTKIQYFHKVLVTQGRSYDVGIINVSQRPRDIHNTLISESEHLFVFSLSLETDIMKIRQMVGIAADEIYYIPEYHFLYHNVKANKSYIFKPIRTLTEEQIREKKIPKLELYKPNLEDYVMLTAR